MKSICYLYMKPKRNHKHPNQFCVNHKQLCFYLIDFLNAISIPQVGYLTKYYDNG